MLVHEEAIAGLLACPICRGELARDGQGGKWHCTACDSAFEAVAGKAMLVDFDNSVLDRSVVLASGAGRLTNPATGWRARVMAMVGGGNPIAAHFAQAMVDECVAAGARRGRRGRLLVIGGGTIGNGAEALYAAADIDLISFDIYASANVTLIADAHALPLKDGSVDGVWIQAVLEHLVDPADAVREIARVLTPDGVVFADTPFLWPVHEGAWDFTRWTPSGYRWLFRDFSVMAAGLSTGPGMTAILGLRYAVASLTRSSKLGHLLSLPMAPLRLLDRSGGPRRALDAAAGIYLFGRRAAAPIGRRELIDYYDEQLALEAASRRIRAYRA